MIFLAKLYFGEDVKIYLNHLHVSSVCVYVSIIVRSRNQAYAFTKQKKIKKIVLAQFSKKDL